MTSTVDFPDVLSHFELSGHVASGERFGSGHINDTFLVRLVHADGTRRYVLQRINNDVFPDPLAVMDNVERVTSYIRSASGGADNLPFQRNLVPVRARNGAAFFRDDAGEIWRLWPFVYGASSFDTVQTPQQSREAAFAVGAFQALVRGLDPRSLNETIANFHDTPLRYRSFRKTLEADVHDRAGDCAAEIDFALQNAASAGVLQELLREGRIPMRVVHNDAKLNNIMFDDETGKAACLVDLDTVMPGLALFDFGDLVRTVTVITAEDETDIGAIKMQLPVFEQLVDGYLASAIGFLEPAEVDHLALAGRIIALETGLRFLSDYLDGDRYFRIERPQQNLERCRTQFALVSSIDEQLDSMEDVVRRSYAKLTNESIR